MSRLIPQYLLVAVLLTGCYSLRRLPDEELVVLPSFRPKKEIQLALILGGGGSKGLAHLGAIQELEKVGIRPDLIIGCSAGAIAGALYADQLEVEASVDALMLLRRRDVLDYAFLDPVHGIIHGDLLQGLMKKLLQAQTFEDLNIPLIVVATDLMTGDVIEISSGELSPAIRASCAIPGIFKPVLLYGRYCVDGGVSCPLPVEIAKKYGAKQIIAIDLSDKLSQHYPTNLLGVTRRSMEIIHRKLVESSLQRADIAIRMNFDDLGVFTDDHNEWLYEQGRMAIREQLPEIQKKLMSL